MLVPLFLLMMTIRIQPEAAAVPYKQPQLAVGQGQVGLTFGAGKDLYFSASADQGKTFGPAVKVAQVSGLMLGRHRGPRMAILPNAIVISAISSESGDLTAWRSLDRGKTWSRGGVINDVPKAAREGLHAMTADAKGNLVAVWLDLRSKGTKLYSSRSSDGGQTWAKNIEVYTSPDGTICQCCHPSAMVDAKGELWVMWRNALSGSRDLYLAHSMDGGAHFSPAEKLGKGTWALDACPMDGGGLTVDQRGQVVTAWRRDKAIFEAKPNAPEVQLGTGKDVALASGRNGLYAVWSSGTGLEVHAPGAAKPAMLASEGAFPALATLPDGSVLAAWESKGEVQIQRLP